MIKVSDYYWTRESGFLTWYPTRRKKIKDFLGKFFKPQIIIFKKFIRFFVSAPPKNKASTKKALQNLKSLFFILIFYSLIPFS